MLAIVHTSTLLSLFSKAGDVGYQSFILLLYQEKIFVLDAPSGRANDSPKRDTVCTFIESFGRGGGLLSVLLFTDSEEI